MEVTRVGLTVFCGGLGGSSPGLFLPKQATLQASWTSELNTVKTSITDRPWERTVKRGGKTQRENNRLEVLFIN